MFLGIHPSTPAERRARPSFRFARRDRRPHQGFTLIELILVLSVGSMITLLSFQGMKRQTESTQARIVGQQMRTVGQATNTYIAERYSQITQLTNAAGTASDPGPRTCTASSCTITVQTLVNEALLPATYQNLNSFGSGYTITLNVTGSSPNWNVTGVVTTTNAWNTGGVIRYDLLGQAMAAAGADSGMTRASATQVDGYGGVWNAALPGGKLGQLGFQVGTGTALYSVYLRRDGTLPMTGDLNLSDGTAHSVYNAANVTGNGRFTSAQNYTNYVNLAGNLDMTGNASISGNVSANGNAYVSGSVFTNGFTDYGSATINGNAAVGGTVSANTVVASTGVVSQGYVAASGEISTAANIYAGGNINTPATISGQEIVANDNLYATNWLQAQNVLATYNINANNGAVIGPGGMTTSGAITATGGITSTSSNVTANFLSPRAVGAGVGGGCSPNGTIGTDGAQPLFCANGIWRPTIPQFQIGYTTVNLGNNNAEAYCPAGWRTISGGGACQGGDLESSFWAPDGGWYAKCNGGAVEVWAGCMPSS